MAEFVCQWTDYGAAATDTGRPKPGTVLAIYPDGTLDSVLPAAGSHVNFVHVDGLSVASAKRLLEDYWQGEEFIARRRFQWSPAALTGQNKSKWNAHQPLTFTETQARTFITDKFGSEAW